MISAEGAGRPLMVSPGSRSSPALQELVFGASRICKVKDMS